MYTIMSTAHVLGKSVQAIFDNQQPTCKISWQFTCLLNVIHASDACSNEDEDEILTREQLKQSVPHLTLTPPHPPVLVFSLCTALRK